MATSRLVIALTGASGAAYALNLLQHLGRMRHPVDLLVSPSAVRVLECEVDGERDWVVDGCPSLKAFELDDHDVRVFRRDDVAAPMASGTALKAGMVICPCSMGTLGRIAGGMSTNLIERAADVCLKERRPLVLVPRETPLSLIHLENMARLVRAGATVLPASPGFYHRPASVGDLLDHLVVKILDALGIPHDILRPWGEDA